MTDNNMPRCVCGGEGRLDRDYDPDGFGYFHFVRCAQCGIRTAPQFANHGNDCPVFYAGVREDWSSTMGNAIKADAVRELLAPAMKAAMDDKCSMEFVGKLFTNKVTRLSELIEGGE